MERLLSEGYMKAKEVIKECIHPIGIKASTKENNYYQVWARDSAITLLGALLLKNSEIETAARRSLETLALHQTKLGCIPNCVDVKNKKPNFGAYADGNSWFVIGHYAFYQSSHDLNFLRANYSSIQKALLFSQYQDSDNCGLIGMQEASDWLDQFAIRGKGLYINVLYVMALRCGAKIAKICGDQKSAEFYRKKAKEVRHKIRNLLWVKIPKKTSRQTVDDVELSRHAHFLYVRNKPYFLPYLSFRDYGYWFDSLGNLLAVISGVADKSQTKLILDYIFQAGIADPFPIKAIHPPVRPGENDWREYYQKNNLNTPDQYHNGGIWPFIGGFYVAALVKAGKLKMAEENLVKLAQANKRGKYGQWEFNEWLHGITGNPMGIVKQAWSAGMFLYAYEVVQRKSLIFF
jgi:glycogen debranching enzyme